MTCSNFVNILYSLPGHYIVTKHETKCLLECVIACLILTFKDSLPQLVQSSVLNKKFWLNHAFFLYDVVNALVHLLLDTACRPRDVIH